MLTTKMTVNDSDFPKSHMFTSADIIKSWYISIIYHIGKLKKHIYLKNRNMASVILCLTAHFMQNDTKSKKMKNTNKIGSKKSLESKT